MSHLKKNRNAFTLIELLTAVAIIGILIAITLPAVQAVREAARKTTCKNNLKQIGTAIHNYHDTRGEIPPSRPKDKYLTWVVLIMPYAEAQTIYNKFDVQLPYNFQDPEATRLHVPWMFCPSRRVPPMLSDSEPWPTDPVGSVGDYAGNGGWNLYWAEDFTGPNGEGPNGVFHTGLATDNVLEDGLLKTYHGRYTFGHIHDGLSNTIFVGEKAVNRSHAGEHGGWGDGCIYNGEEPGVAVRLGGINLPIARDQPPAPGPGTIPVFGSDHATVCHFLMGDGSVQSIHEDIGEEEFGFMCSRDDGGLTE